MANGYPRHALKRRCKKRRRDGPGIGRPKARMFLPYIKGHSERIGRMFRPLGVVMLQYPPTMCSPQYHALTITFGIHTCLKSHTEPYPEVIVCALSVFLVSTSSSLHASMSFLLHPITSVVFHPHCKCRDPPDDMQMPHYSHWYHYTPCRCPPLLFHTFPVVYVMCTDYNIVGCLIYIFLGILKVLLYQLYCNKFEILISVTAVHY